jgi:hypothetical protein
VSDPSYLPYLAVAGRILGPAVAVCYAIRTAVFVAAALIAMRNKDAKRSEVCLEVMRIVRWPWPRRPPGPPP